MDKELVKALVQECKEEQELETIFKRNHINFNNYFKYSGEVEKEVAIDKRIVSFKSIKTGCKIMNFWYRNPNYSLQKLAVIFRCPLHQIKKSLNEYFEGKKVYNG